jgi:hydroxymethylbilane synthase
MRVLCERAFLAELDGSCRTPIAGLCIQEDDGSLWFRGEVARPDGKASLKVERRGAPEDTVKIGQDAGRELRAKMGDSFFE